MQKNDRRKNILLILLLAICSGVAMSSAGVRAETIRLMALTTPNAEYCDGLLKLALSYSSTSYDYIYETHPDSIERSIQQVNNGVTDVLWTGTSAQLEEVLRPVRIPIYRGLLGYRIFMIRSGTQHLFENIRSLQDMKRFGFGQGTNWPDTAILEANGLRVVKALKYDRLFHMLDGGRFDAFPRGIHEPWYEMETRPQMKLSVEENLLLIYKMPAYFFVAEDNAILQREIENGLEQAIRDGRFEEYFYASPLIRYMLTEANIKNRKAFYLDNPTLPPETPVDRKELWLDPLELNNVDPLER